MFGMRQRQPEDIKRTNNRQNFNNGGDGGSAGGNNDDSSDVYWAKADQKVLISRTTQIRPTASTVGLSQPQLKLAGRHPITFASIISFHHNKSRGIKIHDEPRVWMNTKVRGTLVAYFLHTVWVKSDPRMLFPPLIDKCQFQSGIKYKVSGNRTLLNQKLKSKELW